MLHLEPCQGLINRTLKAQLLLSQVINPSFCFYFISLTEALFIKLCVLPAVSSFGPFFVSIATFGTLIARVAVIPFCGSQF